MAAGGHGHHARQIRPEIGWVWCGRRGIPVARVSGQLAFGDLGCDHPAAPRPAVVVDDPPQLLAHDGPLPAVAGQYLLEVADVGPKAFGLRIQSLALQGREPPERHVENVGCLHLGQAEPGHEPRPCLRRVPGAADQGHYLVDVVEGGDQAVHDVQTLAGPPQAVAGTAHHDLETVRYVVLAELPKPDCGGDTVDQHHVVDVQTLLQGSVPVQLPQDRRRVRARLQIDLQPQPVHVAQVGDAGNPGEPSSSHQLRDARHHPLRSYEVGQLGDDDRLAAAGNGLDAGPCPHPHRSSSTVVGGSKAVVGHHDPAAGEVGSRNHVHELVGRRPRPALATLRAACPGQLGFCCGFAWLLAHHQLDGLADLGQVVGHHVGGHAHRDSGGAVHDQVGQRGGEDDRFGVLAVVGGAEVDGVLVEFPDHVHGRIAEAAFGVPGRGRRVVETAEVALRVHQRHHAAEVLAHPDEGVVDGGVAVRVVAAHRVAHDASRLAVRSARAQAHLQHRPQDAALHGLEAVSHIGDGPGGDDRQGVGEERVAHLLGHRHVVHLPGRDGIEGRGSQLLLWW